MIRSSTFVVLWFFVAGVSLYDGYLLLENQAVIAQCEENPICRYLIYINGGDLSLLLRSKALGTTAALLALWAVWLRQKRLALPVASAVALFQLVLLLYLTTDWTPGVFESCIWKARTAIATPCAPDGSKF